jgi:hypothetical protein
MGASRCIGRMEGSGGMRVDVCGDCIGKASIAFAISESNCFGVCDVCGRPHLLVVRAAEVPVGCLCVNDGIKNYEEEEIIC